MAASIVNEGKGTFLSQVLVEALELLWLKET